MRLKILARDLKPVQKRLVLETLASCHPASGILPVLRAGAFMELKSHWKGWGAIGIATFVVIGQSFLGYVTENGQLPPWMPERLGGLAARLSTEISIPIWTLVLIVVCIGAAGTLFVKLQSRTSKAQQLQIAGMVTDLVDANKRCSLLEVKNANLKQQVLSKPQPAAPVEIELSAISLDVLKFVARCNVKEIRPTVSLLASMTHADAMEVHVATDTLIEHGFLRKAHTRNGEVFSLTVSGRAYYVKNKE